MKPSQIFYSQRSEIRQLVSKFRITNPRVFGSVLHQTDNENSDLDLLVDALPETTLFDLGGLQDALETRLGIRVDVKTPKDLPPKFRQQVLQEAQAL
ncbi:MAG: nucleotidyltransferase family protein [Neisseriaceae bacterium]|nr:nucleotidyltransferase family protein [Neisseriaceae bacterium]